MSLRFPSPRMLPALALAVAAFGCGGGESAPPAGTAASGAPPVTKQVTRDAQALGQEIFELTDRTMDYVGSHRGRLPTSLRELGIDSLTPATARYLIIRDKIPVITVEYRRPDGHQLAACSGTHEVLEQSLIHGEFLLTCRWPSGAEDTLRVSREVGR